MTTKSRGSSPGRRRVDDVRSGVAAHEKGPGMTADSHATAAPSVELLDEWIAKYSNWGRWENDHIGTANYITGDHIRRAASLIETGHVVSLAMNLDQNGPQTGHLGRFNPMHFMLATGTDYSCGGHNPKP